MEVRDKIAIGVTTKKGVESRTKGEVGWKSSRASKENNKWSVERRLICLLRSRRFKWKEEDY